MKSYIQYSLLTKFFLISCNNENVEQLKEKASQSFEEHNFSEVIKYLDSALKIEPNNTELHYEIGEAYKRLAFSFNKNGIVKNKNAFEKSLNHFNKTIELLPNYNSKIFLASPYIKLMTLWGLNSLFYISINKPDSAKYSLNYVSKLGVYSDALLEYNQNIILSCEENAILFTNGDIDTFPIWFLQLINNFRKDVSVINLKLLNEPWYVKKIKNNYFFGSNNVNLNLDNSEINKLSPVRWDAKEMHISSLKSLSKGAKAIKWTLNPTVNNKGLRVQDLILLEILKANLFQRPIYFSTTVSKINLIGLDDFLSLEGLVYKIETVQKELSVDKLFINCLNNYSYKFVNNNDSKMINEIKNLQTNYKFLLYKLASKLFEENDLKKSQIAFDKLINLFPELANYSTGSDLKTKLDMLKDSL